VVRQYSLCGDPAAPGEYRVAVLREPESRGGSRALHDEIGEGAMLDVSAPRNHFALEAADEYLFVAGGIGITPILPMMATVERAGRPWRLLYGGRTGSSMAFVDEVRRYGDRVRIVPQDEHGLLDIAAALADVSTSALVYCCGPEPLLAVVEDACARAGLGPVLRVERFSPKPLEGDPRDGEFEVELAHYGRRLRVPADRTLLDVLRDAGLDILSSCEEGTCGSCESEVIDGVPDHRDRMMVCVSRSRSPLLVLDL